MRRRPRTSIHAGSKSQDFNETDFIYSLKAYAIVSVICAHVASSPNNLAPYLVLIIANLGKIGVPLFFVLSGYLSWRNNSTFAQFLRKKMNIVVPWLICGILVYVISSLFGSTRQALDATGMMMFVAGYGSLFYFPPMLIVSQLFFFVLEQAIGLRTSHCVLVGAIAATVASIYLTAAGRLDSVNPYLNPINWVGFFSLGLLLAKATSMERILDIARKYLVIEGVVFAGCISTLVQSNVASYWSVLSLPMEISGALLICRLASCSFSRRTLFLFAGKQSFAIYLLHMPVAGLVNMVAARLEYAPVIALKPIIVFGIMLSVLYPFAKLARKSVAGRLLMQCVGAK